MTKIQTAYTKLLYRSIFRCCCYCCCCSVIHLHWHIIRILNPVTFYAGLLLFVIVYSKIIFTQAGVLGSINQSTVQKCVYSLIEKQNLVECFGNRTNASHWGQWLFMFSFILYSVGQSKMRWINSTDKICMAPYGSCATDWA